MYLYLYITIVSLPYYTYNNDKHVHIIIPKLQYKDWRLIPDTVF